MHATCHYILDLSIFRMDLCLELLLTYIARVCMTLTGFPDTTTPFGSVGNIYVECREW